MTININRLADKAERVRASGNYSNYAKANVRDGNGYISASGGPISDNKKLVIENDPSIPSAQKDPARNEHYKRKGYKFDTEEAALAQQAQKGGYVCRVTDTVYKTVGGIDTPVGKITTGWLWTARNAGK